MVKNLVASSTDEMRQYRRRLEEPGGHLQNSGCLRGLQIWVVLRLSCIGDWTFRILPKCGRKRQRRVGCWRGFWVCPGR